MWGDPQAREFLVRLEHTAGSPGTMRAFTDSLIDIDVRAVLPTISVPTLLIHATDHMTDARFVERDGEHRRFDLDQFVGEIESLRVAAVAGAGQVLVSRTVTDLAARSGIAFEDQGDHELKGVPRSWRLFAVSA